MVRAADLWIPISLRKSRAAVRAENGKRALFSEIRAVFESAPIAWLLHSPTRSSIDSMGASVNGPSLGAYVRRFICWIVDRLIHSFIHSYIHMSTHPFVPCLAHALIIHWLVGWFLGESLIRHYIIKCNNALYYDILYFNALYYSTELYSNII